MSCIYCTQSHKGEEGLPVEIWQKAIDEVSQNGERKGVILSITGGEPLAKRVLTTRLIEYAVSRGMHTSMNSNGSLLDPNTPGMDTLAQTLVECGLRSLNVSLDSYMPALEDRITQTPRAYGRIISGLRTVSEVRGSGEYPRVTLNHVITRANFSFFAEFVEIMCKIGRENHRLFDDINPLPVKEAPGLYLRMDEIEYFNNVLVPRIVKLAKKYGLPLLEAKVKRIFAADIADAAEYMNRVFLASQGIYYGVNEMRRLPCATCMVSATITPDGSVYPCTYHREASEKQYPIYDPERDKEMEGKLRLGNIRDSSLREMRERYYDVLCRLPRIGANDRINPICERLCGPDMKGINTGIMSGLRKAGAIR